MTQQKPLPRRMQQMQQQAQQPTPQQPGMPLPQLPNMPQVPQNTADLKQLLQQYGSMLTPETGNLIKEVISHVEQGADNASLQELAERVRSAAGKNTPLP